VLQWQELVNRFLGETSSSNTWLSERERFLVISNVLCCKNKTRRERGVEKNHSREMGSKFIHSFEIEKE
jgi:hypothetical protein